MSRIRLPLVALLFFLSGASGLAYEVLWTRMFSLVFGGTVFAVSSVLTSFMFGLGIGSLWFGRIADRSKNCLQLYALLEFGIAAYAVATPWIFTFVDFAYVKIAADPESNRALAIALRFLIAFFVLLMPSTLMGATLPVMSKFVIRHPREIGSRVGILYAVNTAGAVLGCYVTGFHLIANLGVRNSLYLAAAINFLVAFSAYAMSKEDSLLLSDDHSDVETPEICPELASRSISLFVLIASGLCGFTSLAYQVLWTRDQLLMFSSSVYAFTVVVVTFLAGLALGSIVISQFADRIRNPLIAFATVEILLGIYAISFVDFLTRYRLAGSLGELLGVSTGSEIWTDFIRLRFTFSFATMIVPTFLMGCTFPLLVRMYKCHTGGLGRGIGQLYCTNTFGCVLGSFVAGFLLIPTFGSRRAVYVVAGLGVTLGLLATLIDPLLRTRTKYTLFVVGAMFALSTGYVSIRQSRFALESQGELLYSNETSEALVEVHKRSNSDGLLLMVNNTRGLGSTTPSGLMLQYREGHIPMLLHPEPQDVLVIGFATGSTSSAVLRHREVQSLESIEFIPELKHTAKFFSKVNHNILNDPRFRFIADDGRAYVRTTRKSYDVIVADLFQATDAGVGNLYSEEHFLRCREVLNEGGLMCQWLPSDQLSPTYLRVLLATFQKVFSDSTLWFAKYPNHKGIVGVIGTKNGTLNIDIQKLTSRMNEQARQTALKPVLLDDPHCFLTSFIMGNAGIEKVVQGADINTDDRPLIEFSAPRDLQYDGNWGSLHNPFFLDRRETARSRLAHVAATPQATNDWHATQLRFDQARKHLTRAMMFVAQGQTQAAREFELALRICPEYPETEYVIQNVLSEEERQWLSLR